MAQTVIVGCKIANGLLLELNGVKVRIAGANASELIGGHGITRNVDKSFMDAWLKANKELSFVKGGFIFIHDKEADTAAESKEKAAEKTGAEPLKPLEEGKDSDAAGVLKAVAKE